jgi:uncharacterized protein YbaP (TraB family)
VRGAAGDVYLLGSIHMLPPDVPWRSPAIDAAVKRADVFVFEVSESPRSLARMQALVAARGALPQGQTLRELIHPDKRAAFDAALKASGVPEELVAHDRPWLAGLVMLMAQAGKQKFDPASGVDATLMAQARKQHKRLRFLESVDQQLAVLAPDDPRLELEEFETSLEDLKDVAAEIQPLVAAWQAGDVARLDTLVNGDLNTSPAARKALLDDRNARWLPQIQAMLREKHVFLVTVGAGHLTGPKGLPALLRKAGFKVEGP